MIILKIEEGNPTFSIDGIKYENINKVNKNAILNLMKVIYESELTDISDFCNTDIETIQNPADKIVYENILNNLEDFISKRDVLKKEVNELYKEVDSL
ncbi:hypothetical protein [Enterococcus faecalis]|uniref:hypothetical protein n=1 Tax=Enterococcus TaxID=1350 RepID=UPI0003D24740|nr:hypothetical protein [Enterococcus faecalis]ETC90990.1 hypothetical protein T481_15205 [Enterococcus faecalis PF3]EGO8386509.1 hypothetical protein [Enterococcus faecalis]EGO8393336.1 hypothetical protein [Enterococcus faecalis]EGO8522684.1 hypothetical protein [Enterococcus faecalis]EGO9442788.1 hypothetical protein [Enterococcus faecalis]